MVNTPGSGSAISRSYQYNNRNQRTQSTLTNGDYWKYDYNNKGEVTFGVKKNSENVNLLGHEYAYLFDELGNRISTTINSQSSAYTANNLNQYSARSVPSVVEILGTAHASANVTVNNETTQRQGDLFFYQKNIDNSVGAVYLQNVVVGVRNNADASGNDAVQSGSVKKVVPKTPEQYTYDFDGNQLINGKYSMSWDGENRLATVTSLHTLPSGAKRKVENVYDSDWRRVQKKSYTFNGTSYVLNSTIKLIYEGWNLVAEVDGSNNLLRSYAWGTDLSGTAQGAGGVGGLVCMYDSATNLNYFYCYDGNGNVIGLVSSTGQVVAQYEYGPFGEIIRQSGVMASVNPFRFSTKYQDNETGYYYYGYRWYDPSTGRWLSRDPIEEEGGLNLYANSQNDLIGRYWTLYWGQSMTRYYFLTIKSDEVKK